MHMDEHFRERKRYAVAEQQMHDEDSYGYKQIWIQ